jgi:hypothetical protein
MAPDVSKHSILKIHDIQISREKIEVDIQR